MSTLKISKTINYLSNPRIIEVAFAVALTINIVVTSLVGYNTNEVSPRSHHREPRYRTMNVYNSEGEVTGKKKVLDGYVEVYDDVKPSNEESSTVPFATLIPLEDIKQEPVKVVQTTIGPDGTIINNMVDGIKYSLKYPDVTPEPTKSK